jgi:signal transduction histidine kinase/DNA-binding response OmpR family regulator
MHSFIKKLKLINTIYIQMFIVIAAFLIMGISSFLFVSVIEHKHLTHEAETALTHIQSEINTRFLEYETFLSGFSGTVRRMILRGESQNAVDAYMTLITDSLLTDSEHMEDLFNIHGYFFSWGEVYLSGIKRAFPNNFQEQPWFNADIQYAGKVIVSDPYIDVISNKSILTFSVLITDNNNPLGIICLDIETGKIFDNVTNVSLTKSSYGILLNEKLNIIAHYYSFWINVYSANSDLAVITPELERKQNVYERRLRNFIKEDVIVYFIRIKYDWFLGIVIPMHEYYRNIYYMAVFLVIIGSIMAYVLCVMLYRISQAKIRSDISTQQKSNFLATMSHEIRTPLNAILGMTEIQIQNSAHPPSTCEAFLKINNSGNLLLNIINDVLDLSKIETGNLELTPGKYEVVNLINDVVQLNYIRYESKPIEFILDIDENTPSILIGDDLRIKQILNNLLSNAFKYTDQGKVVLSVRADCVSRGGSVLVTLIFKISDTGQGMSSEQVKKLFKENTLFNLETNRTTEGTGLGIAITNNIVKLMYGKMEVDSKAGKGTTVTVRLPQKTDGRGIRGVLGKETVENLRQFKLINTRQIKKVQISHEYMPYGSILIVDDVETNLYVAKGLMVPYGLKIDLANNGFDAVHKIKEGNVYDIVFMDHMMPKMDGIETTKLIREMGYTKPIVALTANALAGQAEVFLQNGFDDYISKPIDIRQLNVVLIRLIRERYPADVIAAAQKEKAEIEKKQRVVQTTQQVDVQLAEIFARDAEKSVSILEDCLSRGLGNEEDIHMYVINVHAMKSALANIGENELSAAALKLEQAGRENDINVMLEQTNDFIDKLRLIINNIKPKEEEDSENTESDLVYLSEKLKVIKEACVAFDKKTAKNALGELREKTWSHEIKKLINSISEHLLHSEFDNASALADKYIK